MKNITKEEIIKAIEKEKIIAIIRNVPKEKLIALAEALFKGGIKFAEITYSDQTALGEKETAESIKLLSEAMKGKMFIGAGTVLTPRQVRLTKSAGGIFIISPDTKKAVIKESCHCGLVSIPGALTPTEITSAQNFGADFVKLFPISQLGSGYIKAIKAPLSHIKLLAVGGINENNLGEYLNAGVSGFGVGANIVDKKLLDENDFEGITELALKYTRGLKNG